jgi:hypothetical protein
VLSVGALALVVLAAALLLVAALLVAALLVAALLLLELLLPQPAAARATAHRAGTQAKRNWALSIYGLSLSSIKRLFESNAISLLLATHVKFRLSAATARS